MNKRKRGKGRQFLPDSQTNTAKPVIKPSVPHLASSGDSEPQASEALGPEHLERSCIGRIIADLTQLRQIFRDRGDTVLAGTVNAHLGRMMAIRDEGRIPEAGVKARPKAKPQPDLEEYGAGDAITTETYGLKDAATVGDASPSVEPPNPLDNLEIK